MGRNNIVGAWGESLAAEFLRKLRFKIIATNYRCRYGEIDLIVANRRYIVFVEVKLRKSSSFAEAREFVTASKQRRIISSAMIWLSRTSGQLQPRFDVIEIYAPFGESSRSITINHIEDAFQ